MCSEPVGCATVLTVTDSREKEERNTEKKKQRKKNRKAMNTSRAVHRHFEGQILKLKERASLSPTVISK